MSKKEKIEANENEENTQQTEQKESKVKNLVSEPVGFVKKHGGKIAAVAGIGIAAAIGFVVGKGRGSDDDYERGCEATDFESDNTSDGEDE